MPFFQKQKKQFLNKHYEKETMQHPENYQPVIDPNLVSIIEWVIYVGKWMPGQVGTCAILVEVVWVVYKGYYENKSSDELFALAISTMTKSKTKRFILNKFHSSFKHVLAQGFNQQGLNQYMQKPKQEQLQDIQAHEAEIKNYTLSKIAQKYGKNVADKVESKYGDNFNQIVLSSIIAMAVQEKEKEMKSTKKEKKYCLF